MSQSSQTVANGAGSAVRAAINTAIQALFSQSSGPSAPPDTSAHMMWADTTSNILWKRNAANTGWINFGTLNETFTLSRSSNTMLGISDIGKAIVGTSTFTQTFDTNANLKDGWYISYKNAGTGVITLTPGSGTIDGASSITLAAKAAVTIFSNGSNLFTFAGADAGTVFTGDSGSGGIVGLVPAPAAGDTAANKFLGAGGGWVTPPGITLNAPIATTSGSAIVLSSTIPAGAKRITVNLLNVTQSGYLRIRIGSGSFATSGYNGVGAAIQAGGTVGTTFANDGFLLTPFNSGSTMLGVAVLNLADATNHTWAISGNTTGSNNGDSVSGIISLAGVLDRIELVSTGTFSGGNASCSYE